MSTSHILQRFVAHSSLDELALDEPLYGMLTTAAAGKCINRYVGCLPKPAIMLRASASLEWDRSIGL